MRKCCCKKPCPAPKPVPAPEPESSCNNCACPGDATGISLCIRLSDDVLVALAENAASIIAQIGTLTSSRKRKA